MRVRSFAAGAAATTWECDHPSLGRLDGHLAIAGDAILSLFRSADGRHHGGESFRRVDAGHYEVHGALLAGPVVASSWDFRLAREA